MNLQLFTILIASTLTSVLTVPYGFVGVRGKKSLMNSADSGVYETSGGLQKYDYDSDEDRLWNYLMQLETSQKQIYQPARPWEDIVYEKKLPQGFSAVRGKRSALKLDR